MKYLVVDTFPNPIGPDGRVILKIAADTINAKAGEDLRLAGYGSNNPPHQPFRTVPTVPARRLGDRLVVGGRRGRPASE